MVARIDGENGVFSGRRARQTRNRSFPVALYAEQNWINSCSGKPFDLSNELELERQKGSPGLEVFNFPVQAILTRRADYRCRYNRWAALHG